jgi:hypothetical protein
MATKKCANGHLYDPAIYGDKCPFCPSVGGNATKVNDGFNEGAGTKVIGGEDPLPTVPMGEFGGEAAGGGTVIRHIGGSTTGETGLGQNKRLVGLLVSYSAVSTGEVYKIYEGVTTIGRDRTCSLPFPNDQHMSSKHLLIQYVEAKGAFKAKDMGSSNGSNVNGNIYVMDETIDLKTNDKILLGSTLFVFMAIPQ